MVWGPMVVTTGRLGAGALNQTDIQLLRSKWMALVKSKDHQKGRYLIVNQGFDAGYPIEPRMRVAFYLCWMASDLSGQRHGITVVRLIPAVYPDYKLPRVKIARTGIWMTKEAFPAQLKHVFLINLRDTTVGKIMTMCVKTVGSLLCNIFDTDAPFMIPVARALDTADALRPFGVPSDVLPMDHGGSWSYNPMFEWKKIKDEQEELDRLVRIPWLHTSQQDYDNVKESNALYARRSYQKRKLQQTKTEDEAKRLQTENDRLRNENQFLQSPLQQAESIVTLVGDDILPSLPDFEIDDDTFI